MFYWSFNLKYRNRDAPFVHVAGRLELIMSGNYLQVQSKNRIYRSMDHEQKDINKTFITYCGYLLPVYLH